MEWGDLEVEAGAENDSRDKTTVKRLLSPAWRGKSIDFVYPFRKFPNTGYDEGVEFRGVICNALKEFSSISAFLRPLVTPEDVDLNNEDEVDQLVKMFNCAAASQAKLDAGYVPQPASKELLSDISRTAYNRSIDNVRLLNHYQAGSSDVYGEIEIGCLQKIIDVIKPNENDIFVDLGSGVGHLVAYMAGATLIKKAVGIEKSRVPAGYAIKFVEEFKRWMAWYGKSIRPFELHDDDFLDEKYRALITKKATIVFVNNFVFRPDLEERIKTQLLSELREGALLISTKSYGRSERMITDRTLKDVSSILDVSVLGPFQDACSWAETPVTFYLHRVNRSRIAQYRALKASEVPAVRREHWMCDSAKAPAAKGKVAKRSGRRKRPLAESESIVEKQAKVPRAPKTGPVLDRLEQRKIAKEDKVSPTSATGPVLDRLEQRKILKQDKVPPAPKTGPVPDRLEQRKIPKQDQVQPALKTESVLDRLDHRKILCEILGQASVPFRKQGRACCEFPQWKTLKPRPQ